MFENLPSPKLKQFGHLLSGWRHQASSSRSDGLRRCRSTMGVDIGSQWTKIVWTSRNLFGQLEWCGLTVPTRVPKDETSLAARGVPDASAESSGPTWARLDFQRLAEQLKTALRNAGVTQVQELSASVSMAWCEVRSLDNDGTTTQNSQKSVQERFLETVTDGQNHCVAALPRVGQDRNSDTNESFDAQRVLSLPERLALELSETFEQQRLELNVLDGAPWCLARALSRVARPQELELLLDWGHQAITLVACHNNQLVHCRKLDCPGISSVVSGLQKELELSEREALRLLCKPIVLGPSSVESRRATDTLHTLLVEHTTNLSKQLGIAMRFLSWRLPGSPLKKIWVCGGGSLLAPAIEHLGSHVALPIHQWQWQPTSDGAPLTSDMAVASTLVRWE